MAGRGTCLRCVLTGAARGAIRSAHGGLVSPGRTAGACARPQRGVGPREASDAIRSASYLSRRPRSACRAHLSASERREHALRASRARRRAGRVLEKAHRALVAPHRIRRRRVGSFNAWRAKHGSRNIAVCAGTAVRTRRFARAALKRAGNTAGTCHRGSCRESTGCTAQAIQARLVLTGFADDKEARACPGIRPVISRARNARARTARGVSNSWAA